MKIERSMKVVKLTRLNELEDIAKKEYEGLVYKLVTAIANNEEIDYWELRPYVASAYHRLGIGLSVKFLFPEHAAISFHVKAPESDNMQLDKGTWYTYRADGIGSLGFHEADSLGHALLLTRWEHDGYEV